MYNIAIAIMSTTTCRSRVSQPALHHMIVTARHFSADDGYKAGFIDEMSSERNLMETACKKGAELAQDLDGSRMLGLVKQELYHELHQILTQSIQFTSQL